MFHEGRLHVSAAVPPSRRHATGGWQLRAGHGTGGWLAATACAACTDVPHYCHGGCGSSGDSCTAGLWCSGGPHGGHPCQHGQGRAAGADCGLAGHGHCIHHWHSGEPDCVGYLRIGLRQRCSASGQLGSAKSFSYYEGSTPVEHDWRGITPLHVDVSVSVNTHRSLGGSLKRLAAVCCCKALSCAGSCR